MEEAGVIQNLFDSCDRGMTKHRSLLGKKFTALLGLDPAVSVLKSRIRHGTITRKYQKTP
jgi:hypothetical protein